jgi:transposase
MEEIRVRKSISDRIWKELEAAVRAAKHSAAGAPPAKSEREFIEAVLYLNRTGCPWRDLPSELGYWHAIYMRFRRWEKRGVWQRLWKNLQSEPFAQARAIFLDSTTVRAHHHAAGAPKKTAPSRLWDALVGG